MVYKVKKKNCEILKNKLIMNIAEDDDEMDKKIAKISMIILVCLLMSCILY